MRLRDKWLRRLWLLPPALALISTALYFGQGGFGGGHGRFDAVLLSLGLPWSLLPLPDFLLASDLVWLTVLPLLINSALVACVTLWLRGRKA